MKLTLALSAALLLAGLELGRPDLRPSAGPRASGAARTSVGSIGAPQKFAPASEAARLAQALVLLTGAAPSLEGLNAGSATRTDLARELAARRCGTTWEAARRDAGEHGWLRLGLIEWVARRLPSDAGLSRRDWAADLEYAWVSDHELRSLDVRAPAPTAGHLLPLAAAARVHAELADEGRTDARPLVERFELLCAAARPGEDLVLADLRARVGERGAVLAFEESWRCSPSLAPEDGPDADTGLPDFLTVVFATATEVAPCRCPVRPEGGVARLAAEVERLRAETAEPPELLFLHLGDVFPRAEDHPRPTEAARLVLRGLIHARCDALALGPQELRRGSGLLELQELDPALAGALPVTWGGKGHAGDGAFPREVVLERRGRRIGFVGWSDDVVAAIEPPAEPGWPGAGDLEGGLAHLRALRARVDLLIVGGRFHPASFRALTDPALGVDLLLAAGHVRSSEDAPAAGFVGRTAVVLDRVGKNGLNRVELWLSAAGRVLHVEHEDIALSLSLPMDPLVHAWVDEHERAPQRRRAAAPARDGPGGRPAEPKGR